MNQEVKNRVRQMASEIAGILQDLPEGVTVDKYELDTLYSSIVSESFRIKFNGTTLSINVIADKGKAGA
jgi:hypothetical protein